MRDALGQGLAGGAVADVAGEEFLDQGGDLVGGDAPAAGAADHDEGFGGAPDVGAQRAAQHLGHAGVALDDRGRGRIGPGDRDVGDEGVHGGLVHGQFAEGGQDLLDVAEEGVVRPDDEGAGAGQPLPVRVEQVGDAVQADGGLAGAGAALDADGAGEAGADDLVLFGLDGGDDVAHGADAGALDLLLEEAAGGLGAVAGGGQVLVLVRGDVAAGVAEAAAQRDVQRVGAAGLVEGLRDGGAPVDDHGVAGRVVDVAAADVEAFGAVGAVGGGALLVGRDLADVVESAEEERGVGQVGEGLDPLLDLGVEDGGVDPVRRDVGEVERLDVLAHRPQRGPGGGQVGAFAGERIAAAGRGVGGVRGRGSGRGSGRGLGGVVRREHGRLPPWCGLVRASCGHAGGTHRARAKARAGRAAGRAGCVRVGPPRGAVTSRRVGRFPSGRRRSPEGRRARPQIVGGGGRRGPMDFRRPREEPARSPPRNARRRRRSLRVPPRPAAPPCDRRSPGRPRGPAGRGRSRAPVRPEPCTPACRGGEIH